MAHRIEVIIHSFHHNFEYVGVKMSVVKIVNHNENICNLIKEEQIEEQECFKYVSIHRPKVKEEFKRKQNGHKTMGYAEVPLNDPKDFLKKKSRQLHQKRVTDKHKKEDESLHPPIPPRPTAEEIKKIKEKEKAKNFKLKNIVNIRRAKPQFPKRRSADTVHGDTYSIDTSGFELQHCLREKFGKKPKYLEKMKAKLQRTREIETKQPDAQTSDVEIAESERKEILQGLKQNWEELQRRFQALPMMTDTLPKKNHKLMLERQLKKLEHDIRTIERHPHIYIIDNKD